jgi:glucose-1-phosphatase
MISTVLFDMNDVLCRYDRAVRVSRLARLCGKTDSEVEAAIWGSGYEDSGDRGDLSAEAYLEGFGRRLAYPLTVEQWAQALRAAVTPMGETLALAAAIGRRARTAVLTNNNLLVKQAIDRIFPELGPIFGERFFVSAEFGARKPSAEVYLRCLAALGATRETTLFIDDSAQNVAGAERAGLGACLYRDGAALVAALERSGLIDARA